METTEEVDEFFDKLKEAVGPERSNRARSTYNQLAQTATESPTTSFLQHMYLEWAARSPGDVGRDPFSKKCKCSHGFVPTAANKWLPCDACLPDTFEALDRERHA